MHFLFLSKVPVNVPPPGSPTAPLQRKLPIYRNEEIFPFFQWSQARSVPSCSPKVGPLRKHMPISSALLSISFGVPSKGALLSGSPHRASSERDAPLLEPSFIHLSNPRYMSPLPGSPAGPLWREMPVSRAFSTLPSGSPVKDPPLQVPLIERPQREMLHFHSPPTISQNSR